MSSDTLSDPLAFDRVAQEYERTRPIPAAVADAIAHHVAGVAGEDGWILDAGCGTGRFARAIASHSPRTVGADVSPGMLAELRRIAEQDETPLPLMIRADLRALPFADAQFSVVLAVHILHLIADWQEALAEMDRVLAPGGSLLLGYEDRTPSEVRDFYMREGQRLGLLPTHPGSRNTEREIIPLLREKFGYRTFDKMTHGSWSWERRVSVASMLRDLDARLYSPQWDIPESDHETILAATHANALKVFGPLEADPHETLSARFILYTASKS